MKDEPNYGNDSAPSLQFQNIFRGHKEYLKAKVGDRVIIDDNSYIHPLDNYDRFQYVPLAGHGGWDGEPKELNVLSNPYMLSIDVSVVVGKRNYREVEFITVEYKGILYRVLNKVIKVVN